MNLSIETQSTRYARPIHEGTLRYMVQTGIAINSFAKRLLYFRSVSVTAGLCMLLNWATAAQTYSPDRVQSVNDAETVRENKVNGYTVTEKYSVFRNGTDKATATMVVEATYKKNDGKEYKIISQTGSYIQRSLLGKLLNEERELSKSDKRKDILIVSANYEMKPEGEENILGRHCLILKVTPKRKSPYLLEGRIWIDAQNSRLVRIEGKTSESPSIWVGHPLIRRDYQDIQGFSFATNVRSESKNFFSGTTVLTIEYENYHVIVN